MAEIRRHQFDNGLWLLAEPVEGAQSLAMSLLLPAGVVAEPADRQGMATLVAEMICRGAGTLDAKAHSDALDQLGVQRDTSVHMHHLRLSAMMIGTRLAPALPLLMDMIRRPMLDESHLEPTRDLALQSLDALEDEPQQKVFFQLRRRHYPEPFGRSPLGRREDLGQTTLADVRGYWQRTFVPRGAVLGFAGRFDWEEVKDAVAAQLGDWRGALAEPAEIEPAPRGYTHEVAQSTQVHIGMAYDAVPEPDPRSMTQRAAIAVLSGGMSARLFTEVREKRGLVYSVFARYAGDQHRGIVVSYAGTTAPRAQETLDVLTEQLRGLSAGVSADEFARAIVGMKSSLVMQGESTAARAGAIGNDQVVLGRPRTLEELEAQVDAVTLEKVNVFLKDNPPGTMTTVTIGPAALTIPAIA